METRANYALIGLFTLATIAAALGFVVWFARLSEGNKADHYQVVFTGSVAGLTVGSSVLFNGLRVGQVETLDLFPGDPSRVIGVITVKDGTPVKVDTRVRLEVQGFTGGAYVQLYGGSATTALLEPQNGEGMATIYAERSELQNLVDGARDTITQASQTFAHVDQLLRDNEGGISGTIKNVQTFTGALADNSGNISDFLKTTGDAAKSIAKLSDRLTSMSDDVQAIVKAVDPRKVKTVVDSVADAADKLGAFTKGLDVAKVNASIDNIHIFTGTLADNSSNISEILKTTADATKSIAKLSDRLNGMSDDLQALLKAVDPDKVKTVVGNVADTSDKVAALAKGLDVAKINASIDNIHAFTGTLADNTANISDILKTTADATKSIAKLSDRLNGMSDDLQALLKSVDPDKVKTVVGNVADTSDKLATLAKGLDAAKISTSIDNIQTITQTLADARQPLASFATDASALAAKLNAMAPQLSASLDNLQKLTAAIDQQKVGQVVDNFDKFAATLGSNAGEFDGIVKDAHALSMQLKDMAPKLAAAVENFNRVAAAVDAAKIDRVVGNVDKFATALGDSSSKVQDFVSDASDVGHKVNAAADKLDTILKNVEAMTTSADGKGMFSEITDAARSIKVLAQNLDQRTAVLSKNLDDFTGSGLREFKQIAVDGQKTLQSIQRTLNSFQRNPQQLIFGPKSNIPDFKGN